MDSMEHFAYESGLMASEVAEVGTLTEAEGEGSGHSEGITG